MDAGTNPGMSLTLRWWGSGKLKKVTVRSSHFITVLRARGRITKIRLGARPESTNKSDFTAVWAGRSPNLWNPGTLSGEMWQPRKYWLQNLFHIVHPFLDAFSTSGGCFLGTCSLWLVLSPFLTYWNQVGNWCSSKLRISRDILLVMLCPLVECGGGRECFLAPEQSQKCAARMMRGTDWNPTC